MKMLYLAALAAVAAPCVALAQDAQTPQTEAASAAVQEAAAIAPLPPGTTLQVEITQPISSATAQRGESFALRLVEPVIINGVEVAPVGAPGVGEIVDASPARSGGHPGKLVLAARYIEVGGQRVNIRGLAISGSGESRRDAASALTTFGGLLGGLAANATRGGDAEIQAGARAEARVAETAAAPVFSPLILTDAEGVIPSPPPGAALIVFFRERRAIGSPAWAAYIIRQDGVEIGRLRGGRYLLYAAAPGIHEFEAQHARQASRATEQADRLRLELEPGQTYYVTTTGAGGGGRFAVMPSDHAYFVQLGPTRNENE